MIKQKIGVVWVESGELRIVDPCLIECGECENPPKEGDGFVTVANWFGDGTYPVYAELDEDGIHRVIIEFTPILQEG